jgi:hypothetical protein
MTAKISAWREQTGIDDLAAAWSLVSNSSSTNNSSNHDLQVHSTQHAGAVSRHKGSMGGAAAEPGLCSPIVTAALKFQFVRQALGYTLVTAQDGMAVLLLKVGGAGLQAVCLLPCIEAPGVFHCCSSALPEASALRFSGDDLGFSITCTEVVTEVAPSSLRFARGEEDPCSHQQVLCTTP